MLYKSAATQILYQEFKILTLSILLKVRIIQSRADKKIYSCQIVWIVSLIYQTPEYVIQEG